MNKYYGILVFVLGIFSQSANGQLTLEKCQELSKNNYPGIKQSGLIQELEAYDIANVKNLWVNFISKPIFSNRKSSNFLNFTHYFNCLFVFYYKKS